MPVNHCARMLAEHNSTFEYVDICVTWSGLSLGEAEPVPRVVPQDRFDAVGAVRGWLGELDPALGERLVVAAAVGRGHDSGGEGPLRDQGPDLSRGLLVEHRMRRIHEQELLTGASRGPDRHPAHAVVELDVVGQLEAELPGVELPGRILVEYPDRYDVDSVDHALDATRPAVPRASPEVLSAGESRAARGSRPAGRSPTSARNIPGAARARPGSRPPPGTGW